MAATRDTPPRPETGERSATAGGGHRRVLVVGGGPVGLSAALALRARGVAATVLEAEDADRARPGSRAIFVHGQVLGLLEDLRPGLGWRLADDGLVWRTKRTLWRGRQVYARTYPPPPGDALPPLTSLPQVATEDHLLRACEDAGAEIVWNCAVEEVTTGAQGVRVTTNGDQEWTSDYLVAADGSRSAVRHSLGIAMRGSASANAFVIVDVAEDRDGPLPPERVFHYHHPRAGGRHVLFVPFTGGWRVDLQCRADDDPEEFAAQPGLGSWLGQVLDERSPERVAWVSTYRFLQMVADTFTDARHRVLLAGEAAHLYAPFGARGMNSGIVDAHAAADAVTQALAAHDPDAARPPVATFAAQRREAAEHNRHAAGVALAHLQSQGLRRKAKQRLAAALAPRVTRAGRWLDTAPYGPRTPARPGTKY